MQSINFRTDMADERVDKYKEVHNLSRIDGIKVESIKKENMCITTVDILNENGSIALGKDIGKYITIEFNELEYCSDDVKQNMIKELAEQIKILIGNKTSIIVVGLGNKDVTPDALGPKVVGNINVTRHMLKYAKEFVEPNTKEISALSPGVLGTTGIETEEIVESVINSIKPNIAIVIDSLASLSVKRVGKTIQLSNTGITPGAGVGNKRHALNKENLGVDVIAIGVPTVVDMATITNEAIDKVNLSNTTKLTELSSEERYSIISDALHTENYIVTPKEIDSVISKISEIIASSLNMAL